MTNIESSTRRELVEVATDYGTSIRQVRGRWLVHCGLCKHRRSFATHPDATGWATAGHLGQLVHQRNLGRLAAGGHLSVRRGYDIDRSDYDTCSCGVCGKCDRYREREEWRAEHARDRTVVRPVVPLPAIAWSSQPIGRRSSTRVSWSDGRVSWGTEYALFANGFRVDGIQLVALEEGGWLLNGRLMSTDADLIRAVA